MVSFRITDRDLTEGKKMEFAITVAVVVAAAITIYANVRKDSAERQQDKDWTITKARDKQ